MLTLCITVLLYSCTATKSSSDFSNEIFVDVEQSVELPLQRGRIIPLETSDSSLLYDIVSIDQVKDKYFIRSRNKILTFDTEGNYLSYLQRGGLPELYNLPDTESQKQYVASVKDTVLLRDIVKRKPVRDVRLLDDVFIYLVNNASNLFSIQNVINFFKSKNRKVSYDTLSNYLSYIEEAFLAYKTERYNIKGKEVLAGNCKYYLNDLAFKNFLYPGFAYGVGYLLENAVYIELRRFGFQVYVGTIRDKEVDFVAMKDDRIIYIQVAYMMETEETMEREYASLLSITDSYEKYVVSMDEVQFPSREGIRHVQAWNLSEILK